MLIGVTAYPAYTRESRGSNESRVPDSCRTLARTVLHSRKNEITDCVHEIMEQKLEWLSLNYSLLLFQLCTAGNDSARSASGKRQLPHSQYLIRFVE